MSPSKVNNGLMKNILDTHKFYIVLIIILLSAGFFKLLSPEFTLRWDIFDVHYHGLSFVQQSYQETGKLPLWNPYQYSGYPSFADPQPAIFYPLHTLLIVFGVINLTVIKLLLFFHLLIAALMMYVLAYEFFRNKNIAFLLGMIYTLSGFMVGHASHLGIIYAYAWLPLVCYFLFKSIKNKIILNGLLAGMTGALIILAGHMQSTLVIFIFLNVLVFNYGLRKFFSQRNKTSLKFLILIVIFNTTAIGLSAIQLLPTREFADLSLRSEISMQISQTESLEPRSLITFIVPNYFDAVMWREYWGPWDVTQHNLYIGITTIILVIIGIACSRKKNKYFYLIAALVVLSYVLGKFFIIQPLFYKYLPLFDKIRAPSNVAGLMLFCLIILSGYGLHYLFSLSVEKERKVSVKLKKITKLLVGTLLILFLAVTFMSVESFTSKWKVLNIFAGLTVSMLFLAVSLLVISRYINEKISRNKMTLLLSMFILCDLLGFTIINKSVAISGYTETSVRHSATQLFLLDDPDDNFRVHATARDQFTAPAKIKMTSGYNPLNLKTYSELLNTGNIDKVFFNRVMDLLNVRYYYNDSFDGYDLKWEPVAENIYKNTGQPEYAWFVNEVKRLTDKQPKEKIHRLIKSDLKTTAWVDGEKDDFMPRKYNLGDRQIELLKHEPNEVKLSVYTENPGFMVISENYYPGWRVTVDGQSHRLYQVDGSLRGFELEAGDHQVVMTFDPYIFRLGRNITFIIITIWLLSILSLLIPMLKEKMNYLRPLEN